MCINNKIQKFTRLHYNGELCAWHAVSWHFHSERTQKQENNGQETFVKGNKLHGGGKAFFGNQPGSFKGLKATL